MIKKKNPRQKYIDDGRQNEVMKKYYYRKKAECFSRVNTHSIIFGKRHYKPLNLPPETFHCFKCGSTGRTEIHHEIYPNTKVEIVQALKDKKIYFVCDSCHKKIHKKMGTYKGNPKPYNKQPSFQSIKKVEE